MALKVRHNQHGIESLWSNPYRIEAPAIISFSGGRTLGIFAQSMLLTLIKAYCPQA